MVHISDKNNLRVSKSLYFCVMYTDPGVCVPHTHSTTVPYFVSELRSKFYYYLSTVHKHINIYLYNVVWSVHEGTLLYIYIYSTRVENKFVRL